MSEHPGLLLAGSKTKCAHLNVDLNAEPVVEDVPGVLGTPLFGLVLPCPVPQLLSQRRQGSMLRTDDDGVVGQLFEKTLLFACFEVKVESIGAR